MEEKHEDQSVETGALFQIHNLLKEIKTSELSYQASLQEMLENFEKNPDWEAFEYIHFHIGLLKDVSKKIIELLPDISDVEQRDIALYKSAIAGFNHDIIKLLNKELELFFKYYSEYLVQYQTKVIQNSFNPVLYKYCGLMVYIKNGALSEDEKKKVVEENSVYFTICSTRVFVGYCNPLGKYQQKEIATTNSMYQLILAQESGPVTEKKNQGLYQSIRAFVRDNVHIVLESKNASNVFQAMAIQPVQRAPRYEMLLSSLIERYKLTTMEQSIVSALEESKNNVASKTSEADKYLEKMSTRSLDDISLLSGSIYNIFNQAGDSDVAANLLKAVKNLNTPSRTENERKNLYLILKLVQILTSEKGTQQKNELAEEWNRVFGNVAKNIGHKKWSQLVIEMNKFYQIYLKDSTAKEDDASIFLSDSNREGPKRDSGTQTPEIIGSSPLRESGFFESKSLTDSNPDFEKMKEKGKEEAEIDEAEIDEAEIDEAERDEEEIDEEGVLQLSSSLQKDAGSSSMDKEQNFDSETKDKPRLSPVQESKESKEPFREQEKFRKNDKKSYNWKKIIGISLIILIVIVFVAVCVLAVLPTFGVSLGVLGFVSAFALSMTATLLGKFALASAAAGFLSLGVLGGVLIFDDKKGRSEVHEEMEIKENEDEFIEETVPKCVPQNKKAKDEKIESQLALPTRRSPGFFSNNSPCQVEKNSKEAPDTKDLSSSNSEQSSLIG